MEIMSRTITAILGLIVAFCAAGCGDDVEQMTAGETRDSADEKTHAVVTPPGVNAKRLLFEMPAGWKRIEATGSYRFAQMQLPLAEGDEGQVMLIVYWNIKGSAEANIGRWINEFTEADGKPVSRDKATIASRKINGLLVTTLDVSGKYGASMAAAEHAQAVIPDARVLAAVVEVPGSQPYFIKAVGPVRTMAAVASDYEAFLASLRVE
jgi:hypothetical protein